MATITPDAHQKKESTYDGEYENEPSKYDNEYENEFNRHSLSEAEQEALLSVRNRNQDDIDLALGKKKEQPADIQSQEESPTVSGPWTNKTSVQSGSAEKKGFKGLFKGMKRPGLAAGLILGIGIAVIFLFSLIMPFKLIGIIANMTSLSSKLPVNAVEKRTDTVMTRALATWLIRKGAGDTMSDADTNAVLCKNGSPICSLTWTRINEYFEKHYDLSDFSNEGEKRKVTITAKGRDSFGAKARSWDLEIEKILDDGSLERQFNTINSNKEAKRIIGTIIDNEMETKSIVTRYIARKALMKKYGITNWRGFEKPSNNIAELRSSFKSALIRNTVGKISPNAATYLSCLSGDQATCDRIKDLYRSEVDLKPIDGETLDEFTERQAARNRALQEAAGDAADLAIPEEGLLSKMISSQLVAKIGTVAAIAGVIDTIAGAIESVGDGSLDTITYSIRSAAYAGYAFGDEAGIATNIERIKAGEPVDPNLMQVMAEQLDTVEKSPVFQAETGLLNGTARGGSFTRTCDVDNKQEEVVLVDAYVCPERQVVPNMSKITELANMGGLKEVASAWNNTAGRVFDVFGDISNWVMENTGIAGFIENKFGGLFDKFAGWFIGLFFDVPALGDEATGDQNYDALSAGVWISQNGMMENGVDEGNDLLGGGGYLLDDEQIVAIQNDQRAKELEIFSSQSYFARLFSTDLSNSFINRFLAQIPMTSLTSPTGILALPSTAFTNLPNTLSSPAKAMSGPLNPHDMPLYGYTSNDPVFTADPSIYSDEYCKESAKQRLESYDKDPSGKYSIKVYSKSDPCALERLVIGNILHDMGVTDDKHSFKELDGTLSCGPSNSGSGDTSNHPTAEAINARIAASEATNGWATGTSPLGNKGQAFMDLGQKYGINPGIAVAILQRESQLGTDRSVLPTEYNNFGGNTAAPGSAEGTCGYGFFLDRNWKKYCKAEEGLEGLFQNLDAKIYRDTNGTLGEVIEIYAPAFENDVEDMWNIFRAVAQQLNITIEKDTPVYTSGGGRTNPTSAPPTQATKMSESELRELISSYGLPNPEPKTSPGITVYGSPVEGYEDMVKRLKENPDAGWAAQSLLNGEKKWKSSGGTVKEYLNTAWIWLETDPTLWPDPYEVNCRSNTNHPTSEVCNVDPNIQDKVQVAGYQAWDVRNSFQEVYKKLYSESELQSVLEGVIKNSSKAAKENWKYSDSDLSRVAGAKLSDIYPSTNFNDEKGQFLSFALGKDPNMAAALNTFAVSDNDVVYHIKPAPGSPCGPGWGWYICSGHRLAIANMMMALWQFDGNGPSSNPVNCAAANNFAKGKGLSSIVEGNSNPENNFLGWESEEMYGNYSREYGLSTAGHTGIDIGGERGTAIYTPVSGIINCERTDSGSCGAFNSYQQDEPGSASCSMYNPREGAGRIEILMDNGHVLILGHMLTSDVKIGQRVQAGQKVGTMGCMNGHHVHVEYRTPAPGATPAGWRIEDPEKYLGM